MEAVLNLNADDEIVSVIELLDDPLPPPEIASPKKKKQTARKVKSLISSNGDSPTNRKKPKQEKKKSPMSTDSDAEKDYSDEELGTSPEVIGEGMMTRKRRQLIGLPLHGDSVLPASPGKEEGVKPKHWPRKGVFFTSSIIFQEMNPNVELKRIKSLTHPCYQELGVFAKRDLMAGEIVGYYTGVIIPHQEDYNPSLYIFELNDHYDIDAQDAGNEMRFMNDYRNIAERPNTEVQAPADVRSAKCTVTTLTKIKEGQELLVDYGEAYWRSMQGNQISKLSGPLQHVATLQHGLDLTSLASSKGELEILRYGTDILLRVSKEGTHHPILASINDTLNRLHLERQLEVKRQRMEEAQKEYETAQQEYHRALHAFKNDKP
eukprot:TRINITY_DN7753_c0_g1_i2.p1 TRINITY_DN7753_c0_g1~~TRINITY_DN7753_c0_g1_i2.p1  ORF type:complete len:392 (+),score=71.86 TRINITY_DN7753_c0_g1_i2:48-1178(+)